MCEAVNAKSGSVEKKFAAVPFQLGGGTTAVLKIAEPWANPKLWWPDDPNMYRLRTTVRQRQAGIDVAETPFGFRQWAIDGKNFTLNGYVWHGWNMGIPGSSKETWLKNYRKLHQTQMRMAGASQGGNRPLFGMPPDEALDWCDREGVVVRRCGPLDGEAIGYLAIENDPELKKLYKSEIKLELLDRLARADGRPGPRRAQSSLRADLVDRERVALHQLHQSLRRPDGPVRGRGRQGRRRGPARSIRRGPA